MGTGKRVDYSSVKENARVGPKQFPRYSPARNLKKNQLGGVIFGCKHDTIKECLFKQLFGLPSFHFSYVRNIDAGLPLFLFNYSDRNLYGIYAAACPGQMNINPYGWISDGSGKTLFPAQVQIRVQLQCQPLHETQFKPLIADNYYSDHKFWFEVDHSQARKLMALFTSLAVSPGTSVLPNTETWRSMFRGREENADPSQLYLQSDLSTQSSRNSNFTNSVSSFDGDAHSLKSIQQEEKANVYMKLKELALKYEVTKEDDMSMKSTASVNAVTKDAYEEDKVPSNETVVGRDQNVLHTDKVIIDEKRDSDNVLAAEDKLEMSLLTRLLQEVEELKIFKTDQTRKMGKLEEKLARAESEVQFLKDCLDSEAEANSFIMLDDEVIESFDEIDLDPKESIFLLGGYDGDSLLSTFESYYPSHNVLQPLENLRTVRSYASATELNGEIYVIGGGDGSVWYNTVESFNPAGNKWTLGPSMIQRKGSLAAVSVSNKLFAMGGGNGVDSFSNVEMLDLDLGRWIQTRSMLQKRFSLAAAALNGVIYATGGFDGHDYLKSVEMFDPREYSWTKLTCMNTRRGCHSLAVLNEKLYALGGFDGDSMVPSVEIYDPRLGSWMEGESMNYPRGYLASAVINDAVYAIGGVKDEDSIVNSVETFKEGNGWEESKGCKIGKRCFHSAIALSP